VLSTLQSVKILFSCEDFLRIALLPRSIALVLVVVFVLERRSRVCRALVDPVLFRLEAHQQLVSIEFSCEHEHEVAVATLWRARARCEVQ
jgi:hypothetical protein